VPRALSIAVTVLGAASLVDGLWPHSWRVLQSMSPLLPDRARAGASALVALSGLLLLRVASGLRRRKRVAWRISVVAAGGIAAADLLRAERRPVEAALAVICLATLAAARSRFTAVPDPRSQWFAGRVAAQFVAVGLGYGLVALYLPGHVPPGTSFGARVREVGTSLVGLGGWVPIRSDRYADAFHFTLLGLGLTAITAGLVLLLRPPEPKAVLSPADEMALRRLLDRHGARDSLGYFALRRDKSVVWSASGKAALTYRVVCGVALVSGDPIGDPEAWPGAIAAYRELVERYGWTPAVMGCGELAATVFAREYGLTPLQLGDEAILSASAFCLDGRAMRGVRQACTRVARAGYEVAVHRVADETPAALAELRAAADAWRGEPVERGYSMALSRVGDPADGDCVVVTARQEGTLRGLLHFVPWSSDGLSLDLMRRDRNSDNGVNEYMIASLMAAGAALGVERVSLNFAVFRDALERGAQVGAGPVVRLWRRVLLLASRWWQIESLYRFNDKFRPQWLPRFICYPAARDIPRVAWAAMEAEAFIVRRPLVRRMLGRV
jgi:lysyl-tRNA synthetase class 2